MADGPLELPGSGRNQSLNRTFQLLEHLASNPQESSVAALTRELGLPRTTITRLLGSLADAGAVVRANDRRHWRLGPTILRLSRAATSPLLVRTAIRPQLEAIAEAIQETTMLAVPVGRASAQIIDEAHGPRILSARGWIGQVVTSPASGFVRHMLAELPQAELDHVLSSLEFTVLTPQTICTPEGLRQAISKIQQHGYSLIVDEYERGLSGMGISIRQQGVLVAMIAIYMPTARLDETARTRSLTLLTDAAQRLAG